MEDENNFYALEILLRSSFSEKAWGDVYKVIFDKLNDLNNSNSLDDLLTILTILKEGFVLDISIPNGANIKGVLLSFFERFAENDGIIELVVKILQSEKPE